MRWLFCCLSFSVLCSWLLCALCGKLPGRFLRPFHNHFQGRSLSSAAMFLASFRCAHSLFPSATGVQKYFTLWYRSSKGSGQQEEYTGKKHDEKGAKALSAWSRIRANRLKAFYDELNLSAGYSTATIHRSNLVYQPCKQSCFLLSLWNLLQMARSPPPGTVLTAQWSVTGSLENETAATQISFIK